MFGVFNNISIEGIQTVVPSRIVNNLDFADRIGERRCKKQIRLTGIKERHVCAPGQTSADLAYAACSKLMKNLRWEPDSVDVLVFATQNPLFIIPSTAFFLQKRLHLSQDCVVFDVNLGCSAATAGIQTVSSLLQGARPGGRGLLVVSDPTYYTEETNPDELADQMLFGAAGSAVALEKTEASISPIYFKNKSDGNRYRAMFRAPGGKFIMDGEGVFQFAINDVANDIADFRGEIGISTDDVDYYSFHQAQALLLSTLDDACGVESEKELRSLEKYGNTNGSSPLVTLCVHEQELKKNETANILMCGFGVGLSWCSIYTTIKTSGIYPLSYCDDIYPWREEN